MFTKRQLDQYSTRLFIVIELLDGLHDFLDTDFSRQADMLEFDPDFFCCFGFHADIDA